MGALFQDGLADWTVGPNITLTLNWIVSPDPEKTTLARASSIYIRQTRPLVTESDPQKQDRNYQIDMV
jgi:hypothetical protein